MGESSTKTAIITAVLTGVFTVMAGLATYWISTKEPELSFTVVGSPTLPATTGVKRIFVVEVRNSGKKEIQQTYVQLGFSGGELSEVASEASPGVEIKEEKNQKQIELTADLLNPGDFVKVSFLAALSSPDAEPKITVRAPGVKATDVSKTETDFLLTMGSKGLPLLLATGLAAVLSSFLLLSPSRFARRLGLQSGSSRLHQSEISAFVCGVCQLPDEADRLRFGGPEVTYRGTADYLLHRAKRADPADRRKYEVALKTLLLNKGLTDTAVRVIRSSAEEVKGAPIPSPELERLEKTAIAEEADSIAWRKAVVEYAQSELKGPG